jgi:hypothetical protein
VFAESHAKNAQKCKKAPAPTARLAALQEKTSFAKYAIAPSPKALNYALNAASSHAKPPRKDQ